ncbi:MAG: hypothetical protein OHK0053_14510 [Microscillaceae bacterium]
MGKYLQDIRAEILLKKGEKEFTKDDGIKKPEEMAQAYLGDGCPKVRAVVYFYPQKLFMKVVGQPFKERFRSFYEELFKSIYLDDGTVPPAMAYRQKNPKKYEQNRKRSPISREVGQWALDLLPSKQIPTMGRHCPALSECEALSLCHYVPVQPQRKNPRPTDWLF